MTDRDDPRQRIGSTQLVSLEALRHAEQREHMLEVLRTRAEREIDAHARQAELYAGRIRTRYRPSTYGTGYSTGMPPFDTLDACLGWIDRNAMTKFVAVVEIVFDAIARPWEGE